jgi:hypothetical protein
VWTFRNDGTTWHHPVHSHLSEWLVLSVNDIPVDSQMVQISPHVKGLEDFQRVFTKNRSDGGDYRIGSNVLRGPWCGGGRRDIAALGPRDKVTMFSRWPDFLGRYVMHCHNIVHEDHAMMIRWDVVPAGTGFAGPRTEAEVYGTADLPMHNEARPGQSTMQTGARSFDPATDITRTTTGSTATDQPGRASATGR